MNIDYQARCGEPHGASRRHHRVKALLRVSSVIYCRAKFRWIIRAPFRGPRFIERRLR